jgi:thioredoxin reductase
MTRTQHPRLAVLGAGPVGLEAAAYAAALGLPFTVYERGRVGEHLLRWGHVRLFSPFGMNVTPLGLARVRADHPGHELPAGGDQLTGREHVAAYLDPLAASPVVRPFLHAQTEVLRVGRTGLLREESPGDPRRARQPFRLLVRGPDGRERVDESDAVLDCTGTYGRPRPLGDGGIPAAAEGAARQRIAYGLEDVLGERRAFYADKTVLVAGDGYSAATTVCALATLAASHPGTWVIWLARGASTQPVRRAANDPLRERDRLAVRANTLATRADGNVEFYPQAAVDMVECAGPDRGFVVRGRRAGRPATWEADRVIANVGYAPDPDLSHELPAGEPNYFVLGGKGHGTDSSFLLPAGFAQVRDAFARLLGDPGLDLYKRR